MKFRPTLEQIRNYMPARSLDSLNRELGITEVIKLAGNENNFGTSPRVKEALLGSLDSLYRYPDPACTALALELAEFYGLQPDQLIFGDGTFELLSLVSQALVDPGDEVVIPEPSFNWYKVGTWEMAGKVVEVPMKDHHIDLPSVIKAITPRTKLVWLCNPHNPFGTIFDRKAFDAFLARVPSDVALILDEAYYEYADHPDYPQTVPLLEKHPNIIILRTFSKVYGLAGLRIGYGIADRRTIAWLNKIRPPINVNHLAQVAALAAFRDRDFYHHVLEGNREGREDYYRFCSETGMEYIPSQTNFIMVNVESDSDLAVAEFLKKGILLRSGNEFGRPGWLRITIGTQEENLKVFAILADLVGRSREARGLPKTPEPAGRGRQRKVVPV